MSAQTQIPEKVLLLLPRLASASDAEVVSTARIIEKQLKAAGLDMHDLVKRLTQSGSRAGIEKKRNPDYDIDGISAERFKREINALWLIIRDLPRDDRRFVDKCRQVLIQRCTLSAPEIAQIKSMYSKHVENAGKYKYQ